jgi:hypothetical protein
MALRVHRRPAAIATVLCALYVFCWLQFPSGIIAVGLFLPLNGFFAIGYGGYEILAYIYLVAVLLIIWIFLYSILSPAQKGKG